MRQNYQITTNQFQKFSNSKKIMLLENNLIKKNEEEIAAIMNNFFINIIKNQPYQRQ